MTKRSTGDRAGRAADLIVGGVVLVIVLILIMALLFIVITPNAGAAI